MEIQIEGEQLKRMMKYGLPIVGIEFFLFLIFYEFFAFLFLILGMVSTMVITLWLVYRIKIKFFGE